MTDYTIRYVTRVYDLHGNLSTVGSMDADSALDAAQRILGTLNVKWTAVDNDVTSYRSDDASVWSSGYTVAVQEIVVRKPQD